jgi:hypothetical protein
MRKIWIIFLILAIVIGTTLFIYFKVEPQVKEYVNVSIIAKHEGIITKTGIIVDGQEINTSNSYELLLLEKKPITIKNKNLKGQNFYEKEYTYNLTKDTRIDIELEKPKLPKIDVDKNIITIFSENFMDVKFCLISSANYISIEANQTEIKKLDGFENYDSCYSLNKDLKNSKEVIKIDYIELSNPTDMDFLNITVIDNQENSLTKTIK